MPEIRPRPSRTVPPAVISLLLFLAVSGSGCRLSRVNSELTPLTDDLAERLQGQVSTVLARDVIPHFPEVCRAEGWLCVDGA